MTALTDRDTSIRRLCGGWGRASVAGRVLCAVAIASAPFATPAQSAAPPATRPSSGPADVYTTTKPSADGIGRVYMGREIAQVMGHLAADWLERPEREREERPRKAIDMMELRPTDVVADVGAGSGYFSFRIAARVPKGKDRKS